MRYYSTQRPIMPGGFPKPQGNKVLNIENFDSRQTVDEIGRQAWGWIEYERPLSPVLARDWELVPVPTRAKRVKYIGRDSWGRYVYEDENGKLWKHTDCCSPRELCIERGDTLYSSCGNSLDGEPDCPIAADIKVDYGEVEK